MIPHIYKCAGVGRGRSTYMLMADLFSWLSSCIDAVSSQLSFCKEWSCIEMRTLVKVMVIICISSLMKMEKEAVQTLKMYLSA